MNAYDGPPPANTDLTPQQELMLELGWLELWHALREDSSACAPGPDDES